MDSTDQVEFLAHHLLGSRVTGLGRANIVDADQAIPILQSFVFVLDGRSVLLRYGQQGLSCGASGELGDLWPEEDLEDEERVEFVALGSEVDTLELPARIIKIVGTVGIGKYDDVLSLSFYGDGGGVLTLSTAEDLLSLTSVEAADRLARTAAANQGMNIEVVTCDVS